MIALVIFSCILFGVVIGVIGAAILNKLDKPVGTLRIDSSDPDGPYLFLELEGDVHTVQQQKFITLKVDNSGYLSQK